MKTPDGEPNTPLTRHFLDHIREGDAYPGETWLAVTFTASFLTALTAVLGFLWWVL